MKKNRLKGMMSSATCEWATPQPLFDKLDAQYHFTLDPCATAENAKCEKFFTAEDDGLSQKWGGVVFCNPPYGKSVGKWVRKAYEESQRGATVVMLIPARTDTKWFHDYCLKGKVEFIRGRVRFGNSNANAPFPSMIVVFEGSET